MKKLAVLIPLLLLFSVVLVRTFWAPAAAQAACTFDTASAPPPFRIASVAPQPATLALEVPAVLCVFISDATVVEGNAETVILFEVTKSFASAVNVQVDYTTAPGTASSPSDFEESSGTVTLAGDTVRAVISVPVSGDQEFETDETFFVNLTTTSDEFRIEDPQGAGTIINDDPAPLPPPPSPLPSPPPPAPETVIPTEAPPPAPIESPPSFVVPGAATATPTPSPSPTPAATEEPPAPPQAPRQQVSVTAAGGGKESPPGGSVDLSAGGFASCAEVLFLLDDARIGSRVPDPTGRVSLDGVSVPGDAEPGKHTLSARCDGPGFGIASTRLTVTSPPVHRTELVTSLPQPWQVPVDPVSIGISLLAALAAIVLVAIPAELFNSTLEANNAEIREFLHLPEQRREPRFSISPVAAFSLFVFVGGFLYALLSPGFGVDLSSFALITGMTIALTITTVGFGIPQGLYMRRKFGESGRLSVVPATLVVSAIFVVLSLAARLNPGLIYGIVAGFAFRNQLARDEEGRLAATSTVFLLVICLGAWFTRARDLFGRRGAGCRLFDPGTGGGPGRDPPGGTGEPCHRIDPAARAQRPQDRRLELLRLDAGLCGRCGRVCTHPADPVERLRQPAPGPKRGALPGGGRSAGLRRSRFLGLLPVQGHRVRAQMADFCSRPSSARIAE